MVIISYFIGGYFHVRFSCTSQHGGQNVNMDPFVDEWLMIIPFATYLQLFYN